MSVTWLNLLENQEPHNHHYSKLGYFTAAPELVGGLNGEKASELKHHNFHVDQLVGNLSATQASIMCWIG